MRLILCFVLTLVSIVPSQAAERGLLWRVVQACILNHNMTGTAFPCLSVQTAGGADSGYAVLRPPTEDTHMVVTPTVRTIGIEAERLRGAAAPAYFHDAWISRGFVTNDLPRKPARDDIALAVNSRLGRSQDQLHIHVACIRPDVKRTLAAHDAEIRRGAWTRLDLPRSAHPYAAHYESSNDLAHVNVFDLVAEGLHVEKAAMDDVTIVVVGTGSTGFVILARRRDASGFDEPHGEALLDPNCVRFRKP